MRDCTALRASARAAKRAASMLDDISMRLLLVEDDHSLGEAVT
jgi:hypothetical protein